MRAKLDMVCVPGRGLLTLLGVIGFGIHSFFPNFILDTASLFFIALAVIPWLNPSRVDSVEVAGVKISFSAVEEVKEKAEEVGITFVSDSELAFEPASNTDPMDFPYAEWVNKDPNIALAALRVDIEKKLNVLLKYNDIDSPRKHGLDNIMSLLVKNHIISAEEKHVFQEMIYILNKAVHGASIEEGATQNAVELGIKLLELLDAKMS